MEHILIRWLKVEAVEEGLVIADIVERGKFRGVEKTAAADTVGGEKVAELFAAETDANASAGRAEGPIGGVDVAKHLHGAQSGARCHLGSEAGLIAKLG